MTKKNKREIGLRLLAILKYCVKNKDISPEDLGWFCDQCFVIADCVGGLKFTKLLGDTIDTWKME